jgi:dTDP-4-amino-4,6-dideoxygalactose transaminase
LKIVEDGADAHFALYDGTTIGSWGDMTAFSTYVAHTIMTGVGGITITSNPRYAEILRSLIAHGRSCTCASCVAASPDQVCKKRFTGDDDELDKRFCFERMGYSYRVGELEGALGLAQLERSDEIMDMRRGNAKRLNELLAPYQNDLQLPIYEAKYDHTFMMYPLMIKSDRFTRKQIAGFLETNNIETRPLFPLLNQPLYRKLYGNLEDQYPVAKEISRKGFYIGCHHGMDERDLVYIKDVFGKFFAELA